MSSFTTPLRFEEVGVQSWKILETFIYWREDEGAGDPVLVPEGFITDGASVPKILWSIFPPVGDLYSKAAVIHDLMYQAELFDRATCDKIFLEAMAVLKVPRWKRWSMYTAVRLAGWKVWMDHKPEVVEALKDKVYGEIYNYLEGIENVKI